VKRLFVLLALALLSGCSATRIAYNNADLFLRWQANHYLDFQGEQSDELDRSLAAILAWHRKAALPQYARLADERPFACCAVSSRRTSNGVTMLCEPRSGRPWAWPPPRRPVCWIGSARADPPPRAAAGRRQPRFREKK